MLSVVASIAQVFPYDPAIDTPLGHRNLILIYGIVWIGQISYAAYALYKWRAARRNSNR
jgi:hypothetical protein